MYGNSAILKKYIANTTKSKQDQTKLKAEFFAINEHEQKQITNAFEQHL